MGKNRIDRIHPFLQIKRVVDIVTPKERLSLGVPPFHIVIAVFQIRIILVTRL